MGKDSEFEERCRTYILDGGPIYHFARLLLSRFGQIMLQHDEHCIVKKRRCVRWGYIPFVSCHSPSSFKKRMLRYDDF